MLPTLKNEHQIWSRGQFGSWKYEVGNQDHSCILGVEAADSMLFGAKEFTFEFPDKANATKNLDPGDGVGAPNSGGRAFPTQLPEMEEGGVLQTTPDKHPSNTPSPSVAHFRVVPTRRPGILSSFPGMPLNGDLPSSEPAEGFLKCQAVKSMPSPRMVSAVMAGEKKMHRRVAAHPG